MTDKDETYTTISVSRGTKDRIKQLSYILNIPQTQLIENWSVREAEALRRRQKYEGENENKSM